jgi:parvulin-like peptidyl-prolyl isomerase
MSELNVLDPAPEEWLSEERKNRLLSELGASASLLQEADVFETVLNHWIRRELADGAVDSEACLGWARTQWGHRLESLFLQHKQDLDQASCRLLRVGNSALALEIHHRILAKEASFEQLSIQFAVGSERFHGGLFNLRPLSQYPDGLGKILRNLKPHEISKPLRLGKGFCVVQLNEFVPAVHGEATDQQLLSNQLQLWVDGMSAHVKAQLSSKDA